MEIRLMQRSKDAFLTPLRLLSFAGEQARQAAIWSFYETGYRYRLFTYTSHRFLRVEAYLALAGALAFFGTIFVQDQARNLNSFLEYSYIYFSFIMVLLAMNLLPREREEETLEILWSQPMSRNQLIIVQLLTLTIWVFLLSTIVLMMYLYLSPYEETLWPYFVLIATTSLFVGALTVLVSTYCRHAIATGLVTLLILGVHYYWLRKLGPVEVFFNPIPLPGVAESVNPFERLGRRDTGTFDIVFNRVVALCLTGFVLDFLFRRLKRTAEWFT